MRKADRREIRRYLGMDPLTEDPRIEERITEALGKLEKACSPSYGREYVDLSVEGDTVSFGGIETVSRNLAANLSGCDEVCVMACTLGAEADRMIRRASVISALEGAVYQASASAMAEAWCETVNDLIREEAEKKGKVCHPRFSPGYGDLSLSLQKDLFRIVPITKTTGVSLTESMLMVPVKSVTALIGLGYEECGTSENKCINCTMADECPYRTEGEKE